MRRNGFKLLAAVAAATPAISLAAPVDLGEAANFALLALNGGKMLINSSKGLTGNVGYSDSVVSTTNQKVDVFTGAVFISTDPPASVTTTPATFAPSLGTHSGTEVYPTGYPLTVNQRLDSANASALNAAAAAAGLSVPPANVLGALGDNDNRTLTGSGGVNVYSISSLAYNSDTMELIGGANDWFIFNVSGPVDFSQSEIKLTGVSASHVLWNVLNGAAVDIKKAGNIWNGTILAPTSQVIYHNPASFNGGIIANDIQVHSDFIIDDAPFVPTPEPGALALLGLTGLAMLGRRQRRVA